MYNQRLLFSALFIIQIVIATLSVYAIIGIEATAAVVPETGDWIVTSNETVVNSVLNLIGQNLTVKAGGSLTIYNSNITFTAAKTYYSKITIEKGGELYIGNSTLNAVNKVPADTRFYHAWTFEILGNATINNSYLLNFNRGIRLYSDDVTIQNSIISAKNGIVIHNASPSIINNTIGGHINPYKNAGVGIFIDGRHRNNPIITGNTIDYWNHGIEISSGKCTCINNNISNNLFGILLLNAGNLLLKDSIIEDNEIDGVSIWNSGDIILDNFTIYNNRRGLRIDSNNVTIYNSSIKSIPISVNSQSVDIWIDGNSSLYLFNTTFNDSRLEFRDFDSRIITEDKIYQHEPADASGKSFLNTIIYSVVIAIIVITILFKLYKHRLKSSN